MMQTALIVYFFAAATVTCVLLVLLLARWLRDRRRRNRDVVLGSRYLNIVMSVLMDSDAAVPQFPLLHSAESRLLLVKTISGIVSVTYGIDTTPLRRIVAEYKLDRWLLRRIHFSRGFRRARLLALLASLPADAEVVAAAERFVGSRNRYGRFYALMVQMASDPSVALRLMSDYPYPFSACEVAEILTMLRRGMLPVAYEPLVLSPDRNLRKVGLGIVRQFGIEEAEKHLLRIVARDSVPELGREALYTLCVLRRPLSGRAVAERVATMDADQRRALMRFMAQEEYAPEELRRLLAGEERSYFESLVQSYKRCLA